MSFETVSISTNTPGLNKGLCGQHEVTAALASAGQTGQVCAAHPVDVPDQSTMHQRIQNKLLSGKSCCSDRHKINQMISELKTITCR